MQLSSSPQSHIDVKRRYLMTISSLNKTATDTRNKNYNTLDKNHRSSASDALNITPVQNELISKKIINVDFNIELFNSCHKNIKNNELMNRALYPSSQRNRSRYDDRNRQIFRKGKGGVKVIAKYKYPLPEDRTPMKKNIKIERIKLPSPDPSNKTSSIKMRPANPQLSQNMKKTIEQYNRYIQKNKQRESISKITKSKIHRRNHSSIIDNLKNALPNSQDCMILEKPTKKICFEDFPVRRPLARKDYFVFGMSDRTNPQNKVQYYRDFLWKINFSNALHVCTPDQVANPYRAYIGPGNNYHLVKSVLKRRFWWTIVERVDGYENINFVWTQLKQNIFYTFQQKSDNQIECPMKTQSSSIVLKKSQSQTSKQPSPPTEQDPHKKLFSRSDMQSWQKHIIKNEKTEQKITELTYIKRLCLFINKNIKNIQNSNKLKIHNHLETNYFIGNKKALFYNMRKYLSLKNLDPFNVLPITFHIAKGIEDPEFKVFRKYFEDIESSKGLTGLRNIWIVKPGENTNRGNGITVAYSLDDIIIRLKGREKNADGKLRTFIIQKYIEKPLLYCRRKFDIRHYMLITCMNGIFKAYWYEQGYIRTSSSEFTTKYSKDPFVHLTNDAIQKNGANYGRFEKGNKLSYQDFQKYLQNNYKGKKINFFDHILPEMKQIAAESVRATYAILDENRRQNNFQLLGLDFMIDEDFKPWLIEVNTNPCLQLSCSLLEKIIPQLIDNVFRICVDPLFPPPECWQSGKRLYFGDYPLSQNKFQIIFDEYDEGSQIEQLYKGSSKLDQKMGKIEQDDEVFENDGDENWQNQK